MNDFGSNDTDVFFQVNIRPHDGKWTVIGVETDGNGRYFSSSAMFTCDSWDQVKDRVAFVLELMPPNVKE